MNVQSTDSQIVVGCVAHQVQSSSSVKARYHSWRVCRCPSSIFVSSSSSRIPMLTNSCTLSSHKHTHTHPQTVPAGLPSPSSPSFPRLLSGLWMDGRECAHISPATDSSMLLHKSPAKAYKSDYNSHRPQARRA